MCTSSEVQHVNRSQIANTIEESSTSASDHPVLATPKGKRIPIPGTPLSSARKRATPRATYDWDKHNAGVSLPSLPNLADILDDEDDEGAEANGAGASCVLAIALPVIGNDTPDEEGWEDEPFEEEDSLVLQDLLVRAGGTRRETFLLSMSILPPCHSMSCAAYQILPPRTWQPISLASSRTTHLSGTSKPGDQSEFVDTISRCQ
jgi:hypothetical protein